MQLMTNSFIQANLSKVILSNNPKSMQIGFTFANAEK